MTTHPTPRAPDVAAISDLDLARRIAARDPAAVRFMTERNNQRLFRTAWSILANRSEAEDAVQSGYVHAIASIGDFAGRSSLSTWLTRIVINEALGRERSARRRRARLDAESITDLDDYREKLMGGSTERGGPDGALAVKQIRGMLEIAIAGLPVDFRLVFVMREVEDMSIDEIAYALGIVSSTVKTPPFSRSPTAARGVGTGITRQSGRGLSLRRHYLRVIDGSGGNPNMRRGGGRVELARLTNGPPNAPEAALRQSLATASPARPKCRGRRRHVLSPPASAGPAR